MKVKPVAIMLLGAGLAQETRTALNTDVMMIAAFNPEDEDRRPSSRFRAIPKLTEKDISSRKANAYYANFLAWKKRRG